MTAPEGGSGGCTLAADLGGTHLRAGLVDADGRLLLHRRVDTPEHDVLPTVLVELMASVAAEGSPTTVVVGLPGEVNYGAGALEWAPHLPAGWVDELSEAWLGDRLGRRVHVANDADLAAVGEAYFGAGRPFDDVVYLTVSTGIGAGVVLGRRLVHGRRSIAEIGHTVIDRQAFRDGRPATLEELGSGSSMAWLTEEAGLGPLDGADLEAAMDHGDPVARRVWEEVAEAVAIGVVNLSLLFAPQAVVIGGGLGARDRFLASLADQLALHPRVASLQVVRAERGDDVGLLGAAAWTRAVATG